MIGSIAKIAEAVLAETKSAKLTNLAIQEIVKEASQKSEEPTGIRQTLHKLAQELRNSNSGVTVDDLKEFLGKTNA